MKIQHKLMNDTLYVALTGELDEHSAHTTRSQLDALFFESEMKRVVVDLSGLSFTDSTGVGVFIGRFKNLRRREIPIFLVNPTKAVDKVFSMSGIYKIMPKIV